MKRWWHRWRVRVWRRRLAFRLLDLKAQEEHPIGGKYLANEQGIEAYTTDLERLAAKARHQIMIHTARIHPEALEGLVGIPEARALTTGEDTPEADEQSPTPDT